MSTASTPIRRKGLSFSGIKAFLLKSITEILLIIIGIFLGFQANNWKENLDKKKLEENLIDQIRVGLEIDLKDIQSNKEAHTRFYYNQLKAIEWIEKKLPMNDSVTNYFSEAHYATTIMNSRAPFESLKEFGFNNITDKNLRKGIIYLYDVMYPDYSNTHTLYHNTLNDALDIGLVHFEDWSYKKGEKLMRPVNVAALQNDRRYLMKLKLLRKQNEIVIYQINLLEKGLNHIIKSIDERHHKNKK